VTIANKHTRNGVRKMDIRIKVAWLLNGTTYIAAVCMTLFKCWPLHRQWQIYPDPGSKSLTQIIYADVLTTRLDNCYPGASKLNVTFITILNALTDIYLMAIPLPVQLVSILHRATVLIENQIIYKAKLDLKKKISLIILFSGGWVVISFGILRCVTLVTVRPVAAPFLPQPLTLCDRSPPLRLPSQACGPSASPSSQCSSATHPWYFHC
jgi:hypothetical protein